MAKQDVGKFKFTVPDNSPVEAERGQESIKTFDFPIFENDTEALEYATSKKWSLTSLVNEKAKAAARANAYQNALAPHKESTVAPEDIKERMIRDYMRLGIPEDVARKQVESLLASK